MKIALIGNMNNNNFAIMRYFRDLGIDAHLLLYANDGRDSGSHFTPEADTWDIKKWQPFIHRLSFANGMHSIVGRLEATVPYGIPIAIAKSIARRIGGNDIGWRPPRLSSLEKDLAGYDVFLGSGITPAVFQKIGRQLDLFYPYSIGIEFYGSPEFQLLLNSKNLFTRIASKTVRDFQSKGIQNASVCINAEMGQTNDAFTALGVKARPVSVPMVYVNSENPTRPDEVDYLIDRIDIDDENEIRFLHSARLVWVKREDYSTSMWDIENKHNDWLFETFAMLVASRPKTKVRLIVVEYGPDIEETKELIYELGLDDYVVWVPMMPRKHLLWLCQHVSASVGEFYSTHGTLWGGTGWEALATGTPLIQGFNFEFGEFMCIFGYPPPPFLPVTKKLDILEHLIFIVDERAKLKSIGEQSQRWFQEYNGEGLAKQLLDLLKQCKGQEILNNAREGEKNEQCKN